MPEGAALSRSSRADCEALFLLPGAYPAGQPLHRVERISVGPSVVCRGTGDTRTVATHRTFARMTTLPLLGPEANGIAIPLSNGGVTFVDAADCIASC